MANLVSPNPLDAFDLISIDRGRLFQWPLSGTLEIRSRPNTLLVIEKRSPGPRTLRMMPALDWLRSLPIEGGSVLEPTDQLDILELGGNTDRYVLLLDTRRLVGLSPERISLEIVGSPIGIEYSLLSWPNIH